MATRRVYASEVSPSRRRERAPRAGGDALGDGIDRLTPKSIGDTALQFRAANESIRSAAEAYEVTMQVPFLCECPDGTCVQIVRMSLDAYRAVRSSPGRFLNVPGHERAAGGATVVSEHPGYVVVQQTDAA